MDERGCFSDGDLLIFLSQLIASFGLRKPFESASARKKFSNGNLTGVMAEIKRHFNLGCRLTMVYVKGDIYPFLAKSNIGDDLLRADFLEKALGGVKDPMVVLSPECVPMFGTQDFKNTLFRIAVDVTLFSTLPFETFASVAAHEVSHILLYCVYHPLQDIEAAVDLTAMVMGFCELMHVGSSHERFEVGYLTKPQRDLVYGHIKRLL